MSSPQYPARQYPAAPSGYRPPYPERDPTTLAPRRIEPLPDLPLKPRWPYVVAAIATIVFLFAAALLLTNAANDVIDHFSRYITAEPVVVPEID